MNFTWLTPKLAACRGPQSDRDLAFLVSQGIGALVRLADEHDTSMTALRVLQAGLEDCYEPVPDFGAPTQDQIENVLRFVIGKIGSGIPVAISCFAGQGRTGTLAACYFALGGLPADRAIDEVIRLHPTAIEIRRSSAQIKAVSDFAQRVLERTVCL